MKKFLLITLSLLLAASLSAQEYSFVNNIQYRPEADIYIQKMCLLDVGYVPGSVDKPVIVWFHGGGLTGGNKELPRALCRNGYVVIGVGYRLSPDAAIKDIIDDAAAAVAWAYKHAGEYGGSTEKIYISGHSAGGYLVNMLGLDKEYLAKYGIDADSLAAVAPYSGQVITHFEQRRVQGLGPLTPTVDEMAPLYYVRGDSAPFLVISGDRELELYGRYEETAYFVRMLKLQGHKDVTFYELDGYDHGGMATPAHPLLLNYIRSRENSAK